jgi:C-terminal processing protease CtpA/Prc
MTRLLALIAVAALAAAVRAPSATETEVYRVLAERGIPVETGTVSRAAVEGMLSAIDPGGRLLSPAETNEARGLSIEKAETWPGDIAYLRLAGLGDPAASNVVRQLDTWSSRRLLGLVVDLRDAGGHSLSALDEVAGRLVRGDPELYAVTDWRSRVLETHRAAAATNALAGRVPVVVLVGGQTRHASELLAAVLKGREGVMLLGSKTEGDARVRQRIPLSDGESLFLAVGRALPAAGPEYDAVGVSPDIAVGPGAASTPAPPEKTALGEPLSARAAADRERALRVGDDAVLGRAVDILLGLQAVRGGSRGGT